MIPSSEEDLRHYASPRGFVSQEGKPTKRRQQHILPCMPALCRALLLSLYGMLPAFRHFDSDRVYTVHSDRHCTEMSNYVQGCTCCRLIQAFGTCLRYARLTHTVPEIVFDLPCTSKKRKPGHIVSVQASPPPPPLRGGCCLWQKNKLVIATRGVCWLATSLLVAPARCLRLSVTCRARMPTKRVPWALIATGCTVLCQIRLQHLTVIHRKSNSCIRPWWSPLGFFGRALPNSLATSADASEGWMILAFLFVYLFVGLPSELHHGLPVLRAFLRDSAIVPCLELVLRVFFGLFVGWWCCLAFGALFCSGLCLFVLVWWLLRSKGCLTPSYHLQRVSRPFCLHRSLYFAQTRATRAQTAAKWAKKKLGFSLFVISKKMLVQKIFTFGESLVSLEKVYSPCARRAPGLSPPGVRSGRTSN